MNEHKLFLPLVLSFCLMLLVGLALVIKERSHLISSPPGDTLAPLMVLDSAPIGLIGTTTALGTSTVTIAGMPAGNTKPVMLTVLVDGKTIITKVGPAPSYATSTVLFSSLTKGMLLSVSATEMRDGIRHADRIIIPPLLQH